MDVYHSKGIKYKPKKGNWPPAALIKTMFHCIIVVAAIVVVVVEAERIVLGH